MEAFLSAGPPVGRNAFPLSSASKCVMSPEWLAQKWRQLSAEAIATAEALTDEDSKLMMYTIAAQYERLARHTEAKHTGHVIKVYFRRI